MDGSALDEEKRSISFIDISDYMTLLPENLQTAGFHPIVLTRLVIDRYLPAELETILYLDCDVVVNGSIKALEGLPYITAPVTVENAEKWISRYAIAAVPEFAMPPAQKRNLGLSEKDIYYNSGVVMFNLRFWRTYCMSEKCMRFLKERNGHFLYIDQDILNYCCKGHILRLSHKYNLSPALYYFPRWFIRTYQPLYYEKTEKRYRNILLHPSIIHFLGDERPWLRGNHNPYREVYERYKSQSPWADIPAKSGREMYLFGYHMLNLITRINPWFRKYFTRLIGIYYYQWKGKQ